MKKRWLEVILDNANRYIESNKPGIGWHDISKHIELDIWEDNGVIKYDLYYQNPEHGDIEKRRIEL